MRGVTIHEDERLEERIHRKVFPSGLTVYVVRKPAFTKSYATLATRYGSIDTALPGNGRAHRLPGGIAHFLEHKVFATPDGDAFDLFAARGASANAFTSFGSTRYLFGTSTDYAGNLCTLLDMVYDLHVTPESVEKERAIIGQEIAMYEDDADWRIYFAALQALYVRHPVRLDIAGTRESIAQIDVDLLRTVHRTCYHPKIMVLAAVSPEPVSVTLRAVEERVEPRRFGPAPGRRRRPPDEPRRTRRHTVRTKLSVARPRLLAAFKDTPVRRPGRPLLRRELASALALDFLFGSSGSVYLRLYEEGLVDENFSGSYSAEPGYAFAMLGGETDDVGRLRRALNRAVKDALERGLDDADFERARNKVLGGYARAFNAPERVAHMLVGHHLRGTTIPEYREMLLRLKRSDLNRRMRELLDPAVRCYSIVEPA